jgi:hypothetical protein
MTAINVSTREEAEGFVGYRNEFGAWKIPVPDGGNRIYVTVSGNVVPAINKGVALYPGLPCIVVFEPGREPVVIGAHAQPATEYMGGEVTLGSAPHSHIWGSGNVNLVEGLRISPGLPLPTSTTSLQLAIPAFHYYAEGLLYYFAPTSVTPVAPSTADKHYWAIVGVRTDTTPHAAYVTYGDEVAAATPLDQADAIGIDFPGARLVAIDITTGDTAYPDDITETFFDLRFYGGEIKPFGFPIVIDSDREIREGWYEKVCTNITVEETLTVDGHLDVSGITIEATGNVTITATGNLTIAPCSTYQPEGTETLVEITTADSPYTPGKEKNIHINTDAGNVTIALPPLASNYGRVYSIVNTGSNDITIDADGSETINGSTTQVLADEYDAPTIIAGSQEWVIK